MMFLSLGLMDDDAAFQKALKWVDGQITRVERGPRYGDDGAMYFASLDALEAGEAVLSKYGSRPAIHRVLGRIHHALGQYAEASAAFEMGQKPELARRSREFGEVQTRFQANHAGRVVANLVRVGNRWAIAHADRQADADQVRPHVNVRVTIQENGKNLYTSNNLKRPEWDESEFNEANLYVRDLDGDGRNEVVFIGVFYGASWTPSVLHVMGERPGKGWINSRPIPTHDPLWIDDLDGDGKIEVGGVNVIGATLSHSAQPRWPEVYRYQNGNLTRADSKYPKVYQPLQKEIDELLKENKDDFALLAYRGRCARILGPAAQAGVWERRALAAFAKARKEDRDLPKTYAEYLKQIVRKDECGDGPPY